MGYDYESGQDGFHFNGSLAVMAYEAMNEIGMIADWASPRELPEDLDEEALDADTGGLIPNFKLWDNAGVLITADEVARSLRTTSPVSPWRGCSRKGRSCRPRNSSSPTSTEGRCP